MEYLKEKDIERILLTKNSFDSAWLKRYNILLLCSIIKGTIEEGDNVIEIGIGNGETSVLLRNHFDDKFNFYMFDSFEGLSEPTKEDMQGNMHVYKGNLKCPLEKIKKVMKKFTNNQNLHYIKGWVNDTIPSKLPENIVFVHIDLDLFEPIYHSLKYVIPNMKKGGIIVVDDYDDPVWVGARKACDKIEKEFKVKFNRINLNGSFHHQAVLQII